MTSQATGNLKVILAANIRQARVEAQLTQRQVAERLGTESSLVSKWERGEHRPTDTNLEALAFLFGRTMAWLFTDHTTPAPTGEAVA